MKKLLILLGLVAIACILSCRYLVPERFAVNAPMLSMMFGRSASSPSEVQVASRMQVPEGFHLSIYTDGLSNVRWLRFSGAGDLIVSRPREGLISLLERDRNADGHPDAHRTLLSGLDRPHGIEIRDGWLYIGETDAIGRVRFDEDIGQTSGPYERIVTGLPGDGNHWSKTLGFGPDGLLYVNVGSSCNVCNESDERRAGMLRFAGDGSGEEVYATGLRNTVGFDWQPGTGALYGTDNGRDLLGDDFPPCELNQIVEGGFYGWPIANGDREPDPDFGAGQAARILASHAPAHAFRAHNAPLGMSFVRRGDAPERYRDAALVALHGSWNRTQKDGYKIVSLHWSADGSIREEDFMTGFLEQGNVIGRPVHVVEGPDHAFYVSDDYAGLIWRVGWGAAPKAAADLTIRRAPASKAERVDPFAPLTAQERADLLARGRDLYEMHECASCHESDAAPVGTAVTPLADLENRYTIDGLTALFETPPSPMPIFPMSAQEHRELAIYLLETR